MNRDTTLYTHEYGFLRCDRCGDERQDDGRLLNSWCWNCEELWREANIGRMRAVPAPPSGGVDGDS